MHRWHTTWLVSAGLSVCLGSTLGAAPLAPAAASTWSISLEGSIDGQPLQVGFLTRPFPHDTGVLRRSGEAGRGFQEPPDSRRARREGRAGL